MIRILLEDKDRQKQWNLWILVVKILAMPDDSVSGLDVEKEDHETSNVTDIQRSKLPERQQNKAK